MELTMESSTSLSQQGWDIRNSHISLPSQKSHSDYKYLLFVGHTGSGKTTLVRQLLGIKKDCNFLPTSQSRTTVADFEAVFTEKNTPFRCVVNFLPKKVVYNYITDCIFEAAKNFALKKDMDKVYDSFMEHNSQRFRLKYIFGDFTKINKQNLDPKYKSMILRNEKKYMIYIKKIAKIFEKTQHVAKKILDSQSDKNLSSQEKAEIEENTFTETIKNEYFINCCNNIVNDIIHQINEAAKNGSLKKESSGWPEVFMYENIKRETFITDLTRFCGNSAEDFGKLVSPVVSGMRISGPFHPRWCKSIPKIVIIDGEGIGHKIERKSPIPTSITDKYALATYIILVDSATQPMSLDTQSALLSIITHGYSEELYFAFTKLDSVEGPNFSDDDDKKRHILKTIDNFANSCDNKEIGLYVREVLDNIAEKKTIFFSKINEDILSDSNHKSQLLKLLTILNVTFFDRKHNNSHSSSNSALDKKIITQKKTTQCNQPKKLREEHLVRLIKEAIQSFQDTWDGRLNFPSQASIPAEHWTRIKALTRRISEFREDRYDNLDPVAEAIDKFQNSICKFLLKNKIDKKLLIKF